MTVRALVALVLALSCQVEGAVKVEGQRHVAVTGQGYFPVAQSGTAGEVFVVLRGGAPHMGVEGRLDLVRSKDGGRTWTRPTLIVDTPFDDRNPALAVLPDGTLVVGFAILDGYVNGELDREKATWTLHVTRSSDGGRTWTPPKRTPVADYDIASPYGKMVMMPDGTLLMAVYAWKNPRTAEKNHSLVLRSRDGGVTWGDPSLIAAGFTETALLLTDGRLIAMMRKSYNLGLWQSESADGGRIWSEPRPVTGERELPADMVRLPSGNILLLFGQRNEPFGATGMISGDGGKTWGRRFALWDDATSVDCGYPSAVVLPGGRVLVVAYMVGSKEHPEWGTCAPVIAFTEDDIPRG